jgi:hypothetical protein
LSLRHELNLRFAISGGLDPSTVARGNAMGTDVWDVYYRAGSPSWTVTKAPVPAPALDRPTALINGVRMVLYRTQRGTLAIDTGDKIRTLVGYALPRLADAKLEPDADGSTVTRVPLPNTYASGPSELRGTLTVDERDVPARVVVAGNRAALVVDSARLARAEAVSATFGGRESFPLFGFELAAGRGTVAQLAMAAIPVVRRWRDQLDRLVRRARKMR